MQLLDVPAIWLSAHSNTPFAQELHSLSLLGRLMDIATIFFYIFLRDGYCYHKSLILILYILGTIIVSFLHLHP